MFRQASVLVLAIGFVSSGPARGTDWLQWGFDSRHSGVNDLETSIHRGNVTSLHLLYRVTLPSVADGAPAFLAGVTTPQGVKDLLFLTTKSGAILAVDASTGGIVWSKQPATGPNYTTSSPAVDPGRQYVYAYGLDGTSAQVPGRERHRDHDRRLAAAHDDETGRREGLLGARLRDGGGRRHAPLRRERRIPGRRGGLSGTRHGDRPRDGRAEDLQCPVQQPGGPLRHSAGNARLRRRADRDLGPSGRRLRPRQRPHPDVHGKRHVRSGGLRLG